MMTITVYARKGIRVPMAGNPHRYIDQEPVIVADNHYYQRQIADGDLLVVEAPSKGKEPR